MYNKNRRGSRREPGGTPQFVSASPESQPFIETNSLLLEGWITFHDPLCQKRFVSPQIYRIQYVLHQELVRYFLQD